jgi:hypothetical protein
MARVQKYVKENLDTLYRNFMGADHLLKRTKSMITLKKTMTKDEFYQQMLNIAEEKIIEKHRSMRKKNVKYMQKTIDPKRPY